MVTHPESGEYATPLTAAMVEALTELTRCHPAPHYIPRPQTAIALLNRGWIQKAELGAPVHTKSLYYITKAGALALRIGKRAPGV